MILIFVILIAMSAVQVANCWQVYGQIDVWALAMIVVEVVGLVTVS